MLPDEFFTLVNAARRANPKWFALPADPPAGDAEIRDAERTLGVSFPMEYVAFLRTVGGGYFAFSNVFSVLTGSEWNVVDQNHDCGLLARGFLAISDNSMGDYYGFAVTGGQCSRAVFLFDHNDGTIVSTRYADLFEFLAAVSLQP